MKGANFTGDGGWRKLGTITKQQSGATAILANAIQAVLTTGFLMPLSSRQALHIVRYFAYFQDAATTGHLFQESPVIIDINSAGVCLAEYYFGGLVGSVVATGARNGQFMSSSQIGNTLVDDWLDPSDYLSAVNMAGATNRIQAKVEVENNSAGALNVTWLETLTYEVWEKIFDA